MDSLSYRGRYKDKSDDESPLSMPYKPRKTTPQRRLTFHWRLISISLVVWCLVINYYERSTVRRTLQKCQWSSWESWKQGHPHRVALFADPQIMDAYSYPDRPRLVNWFAQKLIDNYHKRNWAYVNSILDPDTTIFLGDLFDGGRNWDDADWFEEFKRFNNIYYKRANKKTIMSLPGNHDIGFGETVNVTSLMRFQSVFGPTSSIHDIGNHTIVLLDTISLSDFDNPAVMSHPREILDSLDAYDENEPPRILMSHVPLFRFPDKQKCGPLRESKKDFPIMKGLQYQTVIDHQLSQEVLAKVRPKIAFSGDDHDYCHVQHPYHSHGHDFVADEITVKSCSMNMGIEYPAIQLLSLNTQDDDKKTYETQICYLPAPYGTITGYIFTAITNLVIFVIRFLFPKLWNQFMHKIDSFRRDKYALPIAEQSKVVIQLQKDFIGLFFNGFYVIIGVLFLFGIYFSAF